MQMVIKSRVVNEESSASASDCCLTHSPDGGAAQLVCSGLLKERVRKELKEGNTPHDPEPDSMLFEWFMGFEMDWQCVQGNSGHKNSVIWQ